MMTNVYKFIHACIYIYIYVYLNIFSVPLLFCLCVDRGILWCIFCKLQANLGPYFCDVCTCIKRLLYIIIIEIFFV